ncbi:MAG: hypothetical protein GY711_02065 [bacterium]|nr:hypothetical protein [bacterium]
MRMTHYFTALLVVTVPGLVLTAGSGILASPSHLLIGLPAAFLAIACHCMILLFTLVTGRVLREAQRNCGLGPEYLEEANEYFGTRAGYPAALIGSFSIVAAGVLGYGYRGLGIPPSVHTLTGVGAILLNVWAFGVGYKALGRNERLLDRAGRELDRKEAKLGAGGAARVEPEERVDPRRRSSQGLKLAVAAWLPWLYKVWIMGDGDVTKVSVHPWLELSALGILICVFGLRAHPAVQRLRTWVAGLRTYVGRRPS